MESSRFNLQGCAPIKCKIVLNTSNVSPYAGWELSSHRYKPDNDLRSETSTRVIVHKAGWNSNIWEL